MEQFTDLLDAYLTLREEAQRLEGWPDLGGDEPIAKRLQEARDALNKYMAMGCRSTEQP